MQKASFFAAALSDRLFQASPSSLKRDVNNSRSANGMVAQTSCGEHLQRTMSVTVSLNLRNQYVWFCFVFFFNLLFFINEDRNTVSSPLLQAALIEEVAYVKKIIVTGGTYISYSSQCNKETFGVWLEDVRSYCLFGHIPNSLNDEITELMEWYILHSLLHAKLLTTVC